MTDLTRERELRERAEKFKYHGRSIMDSGFLPSEKWLTEWAAAFAQDEIASLQVERDKAKRLYSVAENAFKLQDAVSIPGRAGELNCLQIAKAWLSLEKRAEKAEAELASARQEEREGKVKE